MVFWLSEGLLAIEGLLALECLIIEGLVKVFNYGRSGEGFLALEDVDTVL